MKIFCEAGRLGDSEVEISQYNAHQEYLWFGTSKYRRTGRTFAGLRVYRLVFLEGEWIIK